MILAGTIFTHNCIRQDYCLEQALQSLRGIADILVVVDAESTDGTLELVSRPQWGANVVRTEWKPVPGKMGQWLSDLGNKGREWAKRLGADMHFALQADEVVHQDDWRKIREFAKTRQLGALRRNNYWKDPYHRTPPDKVCGSLVIRIAPIDIPFINDAENLNPNCGLERESCRAVIHHYGFLRKTEALIEKSIAMEEGVWGTHNQLFERMKTEGRTPFDEDIPAERLLVANDPIPPPMIPWLKERGYEIL